MLLYGRRHPWKVATYLGGKRSNRNYLIGTMIKMFAGLSCIGSPSSRTDTPPKGNPGFCSSSWGHTQFCTSKCTFRHPLPAASYRFDRAYSKPPCCIHLCKQIWPEKKIWTATHWEELTFENNSLVGSRCLSVKDVCFPSKPKLKVLESVFPAMLSAADPVNAHFTMSGCSVVWPPSPVSAPLQM